MVTRRLHMFVLAAVGFATLSYAEQLDELIEIKEGQTFELRSDRAYLLFRVTHHDRAKPLELLLMRVPNASEIQRYEAKKIAAFVEELPNLNRQYEREFKQYQKRANL